MNSPSFSVFCDALADNKSLIELDLRNNDINHVGGSELASALKRNTTLRAIGKKNKSRFLFQNRKFSLLTFEDLRWNNVGLIGGRALLVLCETNATIDDLQLIGNNIPEDIMQSIGIFKNQCNFSHSQLMIS